MLYCVYCSHKYHLHRYEPQNKNLSPVQVPSCYVALQDKIAEEVERCRVKKIPPVLSQKEFAALAASIENNDIFDPEELSLGKYVASL